MTIKRRSVFFLKARILISEYQRRGTVERNRNVFGFEISENADVNEELLEELSIHDPSARVDKNGNIKRV